MTRNLISIWDKYTPSQEYWDELSQSFMTRNLISMILQYENSNGDGMECVSILYDKEFNFNTPKDVKTNIPLAKGGLNPL